jgi:hypothetical protein
MKFMLFPRSDGSVQIGTQGLRERAPTADEKIDRLVLFLAERGILSSYDVETIKALLADPVFEE